jgi:hypothetical protein
MQGYLRVVMVGVLLLGVGCGETPSTSLPVEGGECSAAEVGLVVCGLAPLAAGGGGVGIAPADMPKQDAVLRCSPHVLGNTWDVVKRCSIQCLDAQCVDGGQIGPDTTSTTDVTGDNGSNLSDSSSEVDEDSDEPDTGIDLSGPFCEPGQIACEDEDTKKVCNLMGEAWEFFECEPGQGCDNGYCLDQVCQPWDLGGECVGPTAYSRCSASGTKWEAGYCEPPLTCLEGSCVDIKCYPGDILCKGMTAVQECQQDPESGKWDWIVTEICAGGLCNEGKCVSACEVNLKDNSYMGCDYWALDLDNIEGGQYEPIAVVVSVPTNQSSNAEITMTDMSKVPPMELTPDQLKVTDMTIAPGQLKKFMVPPGLDIDGSVLTSKSLRVVSTVPVTLHQFNPLNGSNVFTNDASLLLPSNVGGLEYIVMGWPQRAAGYTLRGFATVVATQEGGPTHVQVWPTTAVKGGNNVPSMAANPPAPYDFYLEAGDVLSMETDGAQGSDLTGTRIVADKKVNVFGGHECANIPLGTNYCDHVEQQLFPVVAWGSHYIADAFSPRNSAQKDVWRVVAGANNVQVGLNPQVAGPYVLNKGEWVEFYSGTSVEVNATGPILLGHFLQGSNYAGFSTYPGCSGGTGIGDPAFTLSVPAEQYLKEYIVLTPDAYVQDYVNIIAKLSDAASITIDGAQLSTPLTPVGSSGYGVAQVTVPDGVHTIVGANELGVTAYGYDCDVSYAYPGGLSLKALQE